MHLGDTQHAVQSSVDQINDQMRMEIIDTIQELSSSLKTSQISLPQQYQWVL
jgi:hypothetical protein